MRTKLLALLALGASLVLAALGSCGSPGAGRSDLLVLESHQFT